MRSISFALLREGSSDDGLLPHLQELIVRAGENEAVGGTRDYPGSTESKLSQISKELDGLDLIFIHRDADEPSSLRRVSEIESASRVVSLPIDVVPVVPIQELEAWLLADVTAIRGVVGRPRSTLELPIPGLNQIELTANPKEGLQKALLVASDSRGRRRDKEAKLFSVRRRNLLERLDVDGPVKHLGSWKQLEADIGRALRTLGLSKD